MAAMMATAVSCQNTSTEAEFEKDIEVLREAVGNIGMSVAVVKDNQIIYTHSFGYADKDAMIPATDQTLYRIASISKSFTGTSIMQLLEQGKISLTWMPVTLQVSLSEIQSIRTPSSL